MTISPPAGRGDASVSSRPDDARPDVPALADGIHLIGAQPGSGYKEPPALVRRADGQMIQLTPLLFQVLEAVDGRRTDDEIAEQAPADPAPTEPVATGAADTTDQGPDESAAPTAGQGAVGPTTDTTA